MYSCSVTILGNKLIAFPHCGELKRRQWLALHPSQIPAPPLSLPVSEKASRTYAERQAESKKRWHI